MTSTETLILAAYFFILCILAVYGWHRYYLVFLYMKHRQNVPGPLPAPDPLPVVTVQLPIFNEMYVVNRLIESVCAMDYPRHLLEIQVLDDSTDETREIAELAVRRHAEQGFDIKYIHRVDRTGYKAGALDAGLKVARGDRKSTRLNSSHMSISYAVFCLKKKTIRITTTTTGTTYS